MKPSRLRQVLPAMMLLLGAASVVRSEQIDLPDVLERARLDALDVAAAQDRIDAGQSRLREVRGYRLPDVRLQEIWMRTDSPAEAFALQLNQERFSFPAFVSSDPNDPDAITSATTRIEVSMPLYTGGELSSRVNQTALAYAATQQQAEWVGHSAALKAAEAYIQLAQAREHVALLERALATVSAHVDLARAYTDQGMLVRSELLRAEVEKSRIQDLLTAAEGQSRVAAANLSFRLAASADIDWELDTLPRPAAIDEPLSSWISSSSRRPDLEAARSLLDAGRLEIKARRSGLKPKIGLVARHDLVDDSLFGSHGDSTAIMAVGSIDLWSGGRHRAATSAAESEYEAAAKEIEQFTDGIALEVRSAYELAAAAVARHKTAIASQQAAAENERIVKDRFAQGVVKMIDVIDASTARREAEMRELVARAEAHLTRFRLAVASGRGPETALPDANSDAAPTPDPTADYSENRS